MLSEFKGRSLFQVDIKDIQGCYEAIKDFDIVGIFTGQSDIGVPTMGPSMIDYSLKELA